jgi:hypothetical protein
MAGCWQWIVPHVGADLATYNPIGRLWYLSAGLKF